MASHGQKSPTRLVVFWTSHGFGMPDLLVEINRRIELWENDGKCFVAVNRTYRYSL